MQYIAGGGGLGTPNVMGLPLIKGPYGRITAINLNTGDHAWMIPNGKPADNLVNNPALKAANIDASNWGGGQRSPILITKTMLIEGSDNLRFIDKKTGAMIYEMPLGAKHERRHDDVHGQRPTVPGRGGFRGAGERRGISRAGDTNTGLEWRAIRRRPRRTRRRRRPWWGASAESAAVKRYFLPAATWPRPSRDSLPWKCALSIRFDGSGFSPAFGVAPL